jgi:hypothetical protein
MKSNIFYYIIALVLLGSCTSKITFDPPIPPVITSDLLISEVSTAINTDPSGGGVRNHYVELFNGTTNTIDLLNYAIGYFAVTDTGTVTDFNFNASSSFITFKRTLDSGKCYVIASPQCSSTFVKSDTIWGTTNTTSASASSPLQLSGNSAIALLKKDALGTHNLNGNNYKIIDVFGSPLVKRVSFLGTASARNNIMWTIAGETLDTRNRTFLRKKTVKDPTTDWNTSKGTSADNSEWKISGDRLWDYKNIGIRTQ